MQMQLKSEEKHLQREAALKQVDEQAEQIKSLTSDLQAKSKEMQDSQMLILDLKSQIIERDDNILDKLDDSNPVPERYAAPLRGEQGLRW